MSNAQHKVNEAVQAGVKEAENKIDETVSDGSSAAAGLGEKAKRTADRAASALNDGYQQATNVGKEYMEKGRQYAQQGYESLGEWESAAQSQIKEHPLTTVLLAAGIGLLAGALLSHRSRD